MQKNDPHCNVMPEILTDDCVQITPIPDGIERDILIKFCTKRNNTYSMDAIVEQTGLSMKEVQWRYGIYGEFYPYELKHIMELFKYPIISQQGPPTIPSFCCPLKYNADTGQLRSIKRCGYDPIPWGKEEDWLCYLMNLLQPEGYQFSGSITHGSMHTVAVIVNDQVYCGRNDYDKEPCKELKIHCWNNNE